MNKGIAAIIATILLLMITIALAGTAYLFVSGMLTGRTSKTISLLDASCNGTAITIVISNDGTTTVTDSELKVYIDNAHKSTEFSFQPSSIPPHSTAVATDATTGYSSGTHTVLVVSPSNSVRQTVYC